MVCIKPLMHIMNKPVVRAPRRRREHSAEFKKDLVARSLEPGVSVAAIAMEGGINANLLFGWRRKHLNSMAQADRASRHPSAVLVPDAGARGGTHRLFALGTRRLAEPERSPHDASPGRSAAVLNVVDG